MENQNKSEIWTCKSVGSSVIEFNVLDETTEKTRIERLTKPAYGKLLTDGGYPIAMASILLRRDPGWRFRKKENGRIYLDGPSIGDPTYHPIGRPDSEMQP